MNETKTFAKLVELTEMIKERDALIALCLQQFEQLVKDHQTIESEEFEHIFEIAASLTKL